MITIAARAPPVYVYIYIYIYIYIILNNYNNEIGALGTITKGLLKGLEDMEVGGRVETIQTTALLRMARILRRVLET